MNTSELLQLLRVNLIDFAAAIHVVTFIFASTFVSMRIKDVLDSFGKRHHAISS